MSTNFSKRALDLDVILRFDVHKAMLKDVTFIGLNEFMEVPDITFRSNLLVLILVLQKFNEEKQ